MTTVDNYQPFIDHECPFEEAFKENEKAKLEQRINIGGNTSEWFNNNMTVRMHTGHSIEEMLHSIKAFEAEASDMHIWGSEDNPIQEMPLRTSQGPMIPYGVI